MMIIIIIIISAHSVSMTYHLGPIMNHSATFLFSLRLNRTGRQVKTDVFFQKISHNSNYHYVPNPYYVDIN